MRLVRRHPGYYWIYECKQIDPSVALINSQNQSGLRQEVTRPISTKIRALAMRPHRRIVQTESQSWNSNRTFFYIKTFQEIKTLIFTNRTASGPVGSKHLNQNNFNQLQSQPRPNCISQHAPGVEHNWARTRDFLEPKSNFYFEKEKLKKKKRNQITVSDWRIQVTKQVFLIV